MAQTNSRPAMIGVALLVLGGIAGWAVTRKPVEPLTPQDGPPAANVNGEKPPAAFEQLPGFREMSQQAGIGFKMQFLAGEQGENFKINLYDHGSGVAVGDYDGDGDDDIYFCNQLGPNALYRNDGENRFSDVTAEAGKIALDDRICVAATFSDYDNDGDQDLFVTSIRGGNVLFNNDGRGQFTDVTQAAGLELVAHSQTAAFFDADNDGDLDLLVVNTAQWTLDNYLEDQHYYEGPASLAALARSPREKNVFYRNEGNGHFVDATEEAGLAGLGWSGDVAVFDANGDGRLDVLITNMFGNAQLFQNQADGKFVDVGEKMLGKTSIGGVGAHAFDIDNDGLIDALIVDMHSDMWMGANFDSAKIEEDKKYRVLNPIVEIESGYDADAVRIFEEENPRALQGNSLFHNLGGGRFEESSDAAGLETFWPWGVAAGDFDGDGYQDAFIPSGMGYPFFYWRNYLMVNKGDGTFADQSRSRGIEPPPGGENLPEQIGGRDAPRSSRTAATADFDGDGKLDLVVNNFNDGAYYYHNDFPDLNYVAFKLRGTASNRDAIGALVTLRIGDEVMVRQVQAASGYLSHSSKTLHFGLGQREKIDRAEIRWPNGTLQTLEAPAINQLHERIEPEQPSE
ncbi:MAG: CRTAC1 family protein [Pirellulales bacterium]